MSASPPIEAMRSYPGFRLTTLACLLFLYAPLVVVVVYSFNVSRSTVSWGGFSLDWYLRVFANPTIRTAALNSVFVAFCAATLSTGLATLAAIGFAQGRERLPAQGFLTALVRFPLVVPEVVTAIATLTFFVVVGVPLGCVALICAHTVYCLPFAYLPITARLASLDASLDEAALDLYATRAGIVREILLPLMTPGILSGFCLAFIVSLDDFIIANFLTTAGSATLPVVVYGMARTGFTPEINAIATILLTVSTIMVLVSWRVGKRHSKSW